MLEKHSEPHFLTPLDSIPGYSGLRYAHQVIFFPLPLSNHASIVQHLRDSLAKTIEVIPLLAGTVRHANHPSQKGRVAIRAPWRTPDEIIAVNDLTKTKFPSYNALRAKQFPLSAVNYNVLMSLPPMLRDAGPVFMVQINFIRGGMIWGIVYDHAYTDGTGAAFIPKVWAAYCRGEDGSSLLTPEIMQRKRLMHGSTGATLDDYPGFYYNSKRDVSKVEKPGESTPVTSNRFSSIKILCGSVLPSLCLVPRSISRTSKSISAGISLRAKLLMLKHHLRKVEGGIFFFPREKLKGLKKLASTQPDWISTNDALASLLYCCITDIRKTKTPPKPNNQHPTPSAALSRAHWIKKNAVVGTPATNEPFASVGYATNARKHFDPPLPTDYIGNVTIWNGIAAPISTVTSSLQSVSEFAYHLRRRQQTCNAAYVSDLIGVLEALPDISKLGLALGPFAEYLTIVNSWAGFKWNDIDWGTIVGGKCERLRFETVKMPGFCLVLPEIGPDARCEGGEGLEVVVALQGAELEALKQNELFMSFAEWRCN